MSNEKYHINRYSSEGIIAQNQVAIMQSLEILMRALLKKNLIREMAKDTLTQSIERTLERLTPLGE